MTAFFGMRMDAQYMMLALYSAEVILSGARLFPPGKLGKHLPSAAQVLVTDLSTVWKKSNLGWPNAGRKNLFHRNRGIVSL